MESPEVRTLVVAELYPWPPVDGYRQRLHHIVGGLSQAGPLDVFAPLRDGGTEPVAQVIVEESSASECWSSQSTACTRY